MAAVIRGLAFVNICTRERLNSKYGKYTVIINAEWKNERLVGPHRRVFFGLLVVPSETVRKHKMHEIPVFNSNTPYDAAPKNGPREGDKVSKKL